jgi:transcriptional regulator with XRE-family HTH domain
MMALMITPEISDAVDTRDPVCVALGVSLKKLRIAAERSQEQLAVDAEIDRTFISAIERGVANPTVLSLASICMALGITFATLFGSVPLGERSGSRRRRVNSAQPVQRERKSRLR